MLILNLLQSHKRNTTVELGNWEAATAAWIQMTEGHPSRDSILESFQRRLVEHVPVESLAKIVARYPDLTLTIGKLYSDNRQWEQAKTHWQQAVKRHWRHADDAYRAFLKAERWGDAAEFKMMLLDRNPAKAATWSGVAPLLVLAGDQTEYRDFCVRMAEQFGNTENLQDAERTCKACLLLPGMTELALPQAILSKSLDEDAAPNWFRPWGWATRALIAYRDENAALAIQYLQKCHESGPEELTQALSHAIRALAQHQLGERDAAQSAADQAEQLIARLRKAHGNVLDVLIPEILLIEARTLLRTEP